MAKETYPPKKLKLLMEMRPALDGFAGIPQETRLLYRGLSMLNGLEVEGMLQASRSTLARGTRKTVASRLSGMTRFFHARKINRYSRVIISLADKPYRTLFDIIVDWLQKGARTTELTLGTLLGISSIRLTIFECRYFRDFIWRTLFAKTLPASDFELVTANDSRICSVPWHTMHTVGLNTLNILPSPRYPHLDTRGIDIFISQTPYPARIHKKTAFIVRYHDAIPVFMPHTISDKPMHQATHFYALMSNVRTGAYFACVSEATRQDLVKLFPEAADRVVTIHNMVSHHYYQEDSEPRRVPQIIRSRLNNQAEEATPKFFTLREKDAFYRRHLAVHPFRYVIMVSTVEPRKNHSRLLAAWEVIKADIDPNLKLVIVGDLGWDFDLLMHSFKAGIEKGEVFFLNKVPSPDLRVLYRHAMVTVCPSLGEGFDFSGIESMRSGGITIASDIPVHREIYDDAAEYFDPYSTMSLVNCIKKVIYDPDSPQANEYLRTRGQEVSARYLPDNILPQWEAFLQSVIRERNSIFMKKRLRMQIYKRNGSIPA